MNYYISKHSLSPNIGAIENIAGQKPHYLPKTEFFLQYDSNKLKGRFRVRERFVRCIETRNNGKVWEDSCVEFFFSPDKNKPEQYFNLEINCGATFLCRFNRKPRTDFIEFSEKELSSIKINSNLPKIIDPEIAEELIWHINFEIPFELLNNYLPVKTPGKGDIWKGNFNKTNSNSSNPHYITWAEFRTEKPDFHRPEFFGNLIFD